MILTKEDRHKQAEKWAKATGSGPGKREYINAYFAGYFDHAQTRSDPIEAHIIQQFEELEHQRDTLLGLFSDYDFECKDVKTAEALWNLMCLKKSEINAELFKVSKERDTAHAAAITAAEDLYKTLMAICEFHGHRWCGECESDLRGSADLSGYTTFICLDTKEAIDKYRALTPANAQCLYDLRIAEAVLAEAKWWDEKHGAQHDGNWKVRARERLASASAEVERLQSQGLNTKGESA